MPNEAARTWSYYVLYHHRKPKKLNWKGFVPSEKGALKPRKHFVYGRYVNLVLQRFPRPTSSKRVNRLMELAMKMHRLTDAQR